MSGFNEILVQTGYYAVVMFITLFLIGFLQKGFFWEFFKIKISFGKYIMVKVKAVNRDYYRVGSISEGMLVYKMAKYDTKRITIKNQNVFYRSIGVLWVDVDEELNAIIDPINLEGVTGYDPVKYNNLYVRALTRPNIKDKIDQIILAGVILLAVLIAVVGFLLFKQGTQIEALHGLVANASSKGVIVAGV